jgi:homoserine dehydrogenase
MRPANATGKAMQGLGIGLLGLGTVGGGVARLLNQESERLARRAGRPLELRWGVVRDLDRPRSGPAPSRGLVTRFEPVLDDPDVHLVVETLGGLEPARSWVLAALAAGKDVVTANKALLAEHGTEIFDVARRHSRAVAFEASVGGGIPILQALQVGLAANQVQSIAAIVNGTCNFILTAMSRQGMSYESALAQAQALGYAEPDPTLDVDGTDTAHKLAVLARVAFGASVATAAIPRQGIDRLQVDDIRYASELGYAVKLLARAQLGPAGLELRVAPRLVPRGTPLAEVSGPYNAIRVVGDAVGDTLFCGRGAGALPTASAVVADILDVAVGRAAITSRELDRWLGDREPPRLAGPGDVRTRAYLRFDIADRPGVLGTIARILGHHGISISSVIQHDPGGDAQFVPLVFMTHQAPESSLFRAIDEIDALDVVAPPSVCLGVENAAEAGD